MTYQPIINVSISSNEKKTPAVFERWTEGHPIIAKRLRHEVKALRFGDIETETEVIELKYGLDAISSMNSGHLENQLQENAFTSGKETYLIVIDVPNYRFSISEINRLHHIAQRFKVKMYHCSNPLDMMDHVWEIIRGNQEYHFADGIVAMKQGNKRSSKNLALVDSFFSLVKGVSRPFAAFFIQDRWETWKDVLIAISLNPDYIRTFLLRFYKRNMDVLAARIENSIGIFRRDLYENIER